MVKVLWGSTTTLFWGPLCFLGLSVSQLAAALLTSSQEHTGHNSTQKEPPVVTLNPQCSSLTLNVSLGSSGLSEE